jgi:hypothetical protein
MGIYKISVLIYDKNYFQQNKNPRPKGRGIGTPGPEEGTPQAAGNLPALIQNYFINDN